MNDSSGGKARTRVTARVAGYAVRSPFAHARAEVETDIATGKISKFVVRRPSHSFRRGPCVEFFQTDPAMHEGPRHDRCTFRRIARTLSPTRPHRRGGVVPALRRTP